MSAWSWHARRALEGLRWQGALGLLLLAAGAALAVAVIPARQLQLDALQAEFAARREHLRLTGAARHGRGAQGAPLLDFYGFFPPPATLPDWLERIYGAAARHGLALETGDYQLVREPGRRLARYQLTLPVKGSYGRIRAFIAEVLQEVPAAALEEVGFKRDAIGSTTLDARLRFTLFLAQP